MPASAATFTADSHATLVSAINSANGNSEADIINITADITLTANLPGITSDITFNGGGFTIDGADSYTAFLVTIGGKNVVFNDLVIARSNGHSIRHLTTTGGVGTMRLNRVTARDGGGGLICNQNNLTINDSVFRNNTSADYGGGVSAGLACAVSINRSAIHDNTALYWGGGIAVLASSGSVTVTNSSIYGNTTTDTTDGAGGGLFATNGGTIRLRHVTVTDNSSAGTAANRGGGIRLENGKLHLQNSIVYGNTRGDCSRGPALSTNSGNIIGSVSNCGAGTGGLSDDPRLSASATGSPPYFALETGSPAIDAVACLSGIRSDQRGMARRSGSRCDIGAYEFQYPPVPPSADRGGRGGGSGDDEATPTAIPVIRYSPEQSCQTLQPSIVVSNASSGIQVRA